MADFSDEIARIEAFRNRLVRESVSKQDIKGFVKGLKGEGGPVVQFSFDQRQSLELLSYLEALKIGGPRVVASELNKAAFLWQREIRRHTPVETGLLRQSWDVLLANAGQLPMLVAAVGSNLWYAVDLEFGNSYIAGGAVETWQVGDAPILNWPAKDRDGTDERDAQGKFKATNKAEFMPMMRGSWPIVVPTIIDRLRNRLAKFLREGR